MEWGVYVCGSRGVVALSQDERGEDNVADERQDEDGDAQIHAGGIGVSSRRVN